MTDSDHTQVTSFSGGLLLSILASLQSGDVLETAVLAFVGAVASFFASLMCKEIWRWYQERRGRQ